VLRSDTWYAPPSKPAKTVLENKMKVKFLKNGRWAHSEIARGQFDFVEGQEMDGIAEVDAIAMKESGNAEILGDGASKKVEAEAELEADPDASKLISNDSMKGKKKAWDK